LAYAADDRIDVAAVLRCSDRPSTALAVNEESVTLRLCACEANAP
jgi:hypothetical protein